MGRLHPMFQPHTLLVCERKCTPYLSLERGSLVTVADPGEGPGGLPSPPPIFSSTEAWRAEKSLGGARPPPPPPLSQGLDLALFHTYLKKLSRKTIAILDRYYSVRGLHYNGSYPATLHTATKNVSETYRICNDSLSRSARRSFVIAPLKKLIQNNRS